LIPSIFRSFSLSSSEKVIVFPLAGNTLRSGSNSFEKERLKSFRPEKPESTIINEKAPANTPMAAIMVIILIALLLLLVKRYRLAM
jgi:hypothetical protein